MTAFLRPWDTGDAARLLAVRQEAPDLDSQFGQAAFADEDEAREHIRGSLVPGARSRHWAIVADGVVVGDVGLSAIEHRHGTAWVSYWLAPEARGHGYAVRAVVAVADEAFASGLFRLELGHRVNNPASCRVASAAGFLVEGLERRKLRYGTERFDVETHARLADDPRPERTGLPLTHPAR